MKEYFEKVEINSEADLPKEGAFYVHEKIYEDALLRIWKLPLPHIKLWLKNIDWYLRPVSQPTELRDELIKLVRKAKQGSMCRSQYSNYEYWEFDNENVLINTINRWGLNQSPN